MILSDVASWFFRLGASARLPSGALHPCSWIPLPHPLHEFLRRGHGRKPALAHQRPIRELARLLDLRQRGRRVQPSAEFQLHYRRFRILRVVAWLRTHRRHPHHPRNPAAVVDKHPIPPDASSVSLAPPAGSSPHPMLCAPRAPGRQSSMSRGRSLPESKP